MPILVSQTSVAGSGTGTAVSTSFSASVAAGNGVVVAIDAQADTISSVTDNKGNTYTLARKNSFFGTNTASLYHCGNIATGGSPFDVTVNFSGSTTCDKIVAVEVVGHLTLDQVNGSATNNQNPQAGPITTTFADTIVFVTLSKNGSVITRPAGYTEDVTGADAATAHNVYTSIQTGLDPQWTTTVGTANARVIASYTSSFTGAVTPTWYPPDSLYGPPLMGAPWRTFTQQLYATPTPPADPTPPVPVYADLGVVWGPDQTAPWMFGRMIPNELNVVPTPPPPAPSNQQATVPEFLLGPPIPGSPWFAMAIMFSQEGTSPAPPPTPRPADSGGGRGKQKPFINRVPKENHERRLARLSETLEGMINSLVSQGILILTGNAEFALRPGCFVEARDPTVTDDKRAGVVQGSHWLNSMTQSVYICVDNTADAASWKLIA